MKLLWLYVESSGKSDRKMSSPKKSWFLDKYARFVPSTSSDNAFIGGASIDKSDKGEWKVLNSNLSFNFLKDRPQYKKA